jgi:hypothetical protein
MTTNQYPISSIRAVAMIIANGILRVCNRQSVAPITHGQAASSDIQDAHSAEKFMSAMPSRDCEPEVNVIPDARDELKVRLTDCCDLTLQPSEASIGSPSTKSEPVMEIVHLTQKILAKRWGISEASLERWRSDGVGPVFIKLRSVPAQKTASSPRFRGADVHNGNQSGPGIPGRSSNGAWACP